jgi:hypothetical protein
MPDITMCNNKHCTLKEQCYRYKAKPNKLRQTYSTFKQVEGDCMHFIKNDVKKLETI